MAEDKEQPPEDSAAKCFKGLKVNKQHLEFMVKMPGAKLGLNTRYSYGEPCPVLLNSVHCISSSRG